MNNINGYLITKKSSYNYYHFAKLNEKKILNIENKSYEGIGRLWNCGLDKNAPDEIKVSVNVATENYSLNLMYDIFFERKSVVDVLNYLNSSGHNPKYEIIAIYSEILSNFSNTFEDEKIEFLGIDVDENGLWPIKEELFASQISNSIKPVFTPYFKLLNKNGLFNNINDAKEFISEYDSCQESESLEDLDSLEVDYLHLYRFKK